MSIPLLRELHEDARRLVIAGAGMAVDDMRLKRFLPQLQQFGEKAPIFKRVAEEVEGVTRAQQENAADKLLDLMVLLQAVLHTQSSIEAPGELLPAGIEQTNNKVITSIPYRKLKPLIDSLTLRGPNRLEVIKHGVEAGLFIDIRTFAPAVNALRDSYSEIADYVAEHVIPLIGSTALPILHGEFDMQGGSGDARMLVCLYKLTENEKELWPTLLSAQKDGGLPVRVAAISLTAGLPSFEEELLDLSHDRKKEVRSAALMALSRFHSAHVVDRLMDSFKKKDTDITIAPIQACELPALTEQLLTFGLELVERAVSAKQEEAWREKLTAVLTCLESKTNDLSVRDFLMQMINNDQLDFKEMEPMMSQAADIILDSKNNEALEFLHEIRDRRSYLIAYSFKAAQQVLSPADVFDLYEGYVVEKKSKTARELLQAIYELTPHSVVQAVFAHNQEQWSWDARWADRFITLNEEELVCRLVERPNEKAIHYLVEKAKVAPQLMKQRSIHILYTLFRLGHTETPEMLMSALELSTQKSFYYMDRDLQLLIAMLPGRYAERLQQIAEKMSSEHSRDQMKQLAEHIAAKPAELESKPEGAGFLAWIKNKLF
ncbi:hypothetical protein [Bacillus sp. FJAT-28004]|uniref:hypothetical protein n=1 Tax=Bacillus sp. FJAT-28004 TaxID=1679165 RepID=UPI0006B4DAC4|nr:hypothetical protein [Bacillus sp. FJAT-28004]